MTLTHIRFLPVAAAVCGLLVVPVAVAETPSDSGAPKATASASLNKQLKKLKKRVNQLEQRLQAVSGQPGPPGQQGTQGPAGQQGTQGPAGTAPACTGNGSGDTMVAAGAVCIDRYEASIWTAAEGGTQITGTIPCNANGQDCNNIFARSVPGVTPRFSPTWFQAQQALANVGKRLPTNAEWQQAVAGTPDPGTDNGTTDCNTGSTFNVANTGSRSNCVSRFGANDMVGNLAEWVADWDEEASACANWPAGFGSDLTCLGRGSGEASTRFPGALFRGGDRNDGTGAGPFAVDGVFQPSIPSPFIGFRGAR
jgi:hypothetical protein